MDWTQESVIEFIELYKRKEIIWDPKYSVHFNKIRKQDAWEELGIEIVTVHSDPCEEEGSCMWGSNVI
jgi:hypothetical protein